MTPLQKKLEILGRNIAKFGLSSAIIIVSILLIQFIVERARAGEWENDKHWSRLLNFFIIGVR